jgi:5-bromo-4-chloroindolyl phosphate hydrolysis protein
LGIAIIVLMVLGHLLGRDEFFATIILGILPFMVLSIFVLARGSILRKRIKRMQQYVAQLGGRNYCLIKDLSTSTGLNSRFLVKDLQKMISAGMFPEGHIDDKKTCFMLDNESYKLYLNLQENMEQVKIQEAKKQEEQRKEEAKRQAAVKNSGVLDKEVRAAIEEGRIFINKVREANYAIPGEEVSLKLDRLEDVIGKIFDYVEIHPEQLPEIRKFMEYYLPTTMKLVDAYKEFDSQPVQGENISNAKNEIEKTLDTINLAFEKLLDDLFEDAAMDVSTDISVLNTLLAQEGLTEKKFKGTTK